MREEIVKKSECTIESKKYARQLLEFCIVKCSVSMLGLFLVYNFQFGNNKTDNVIRMYNSKNFA